MLAAIHSSGISHHAPIQRESQDSISLKSSNFDKSCEGSTRIKHC